ncbi:MAG: hypothetical protein ACM3U1_06365 [Chloroflexota bacterium]
MKTKKLIFDILIIILITVIFLSHEGKAQNPPPLPVLGVQYEYDLNGNRIERSYTMVLMKRGLPNDSTEVEAALGAENKITVAPNPTTGILKLEITG